jgi:hypothetical protein
LSEQTNACGVNIPHISEHTYQELEFNNFEDFFSDIEEEVGILFIEHGLLDS